MPIDINSLRTYKGGDPDAYRLYMTQRYKDPTLGALASVQSRRMKWNGVACLLLFAGSTRGEAAVDRRLANKNGECSFYFTCQSQFGGGSVPCPREKHASFASSGSRPYRRLLCFSRYPHGPKIRSLTPKIFFLFSIFEYNHIMVSLLDYLFKTYSIHPSNIGLHLGTTVDSQNRFKAWTLGHVATGRYG